MEGVGLFFPLLMERRLLKEILIDQRSVFEKKRPGTRRDLLSEVVSPCQRLALCIIRTSIT
jgi:hypothetical protein